MNSYLILIRGINVGGKNMVSMALLRTCLEEMGFKNVSTFIASGNVILSSDKNEEQVREIIEDGLPKNFKLDSKLIRVLVLTRKQLEVVIEDRPKGFGDEPSMYHSDVVFLMGIDSKEALAVFDPREGVDTVWPGNGVIYSQRLSELRTKSRLSKVVGTKEYQSMTIRTWNTVTKLCGLLEAAEIQS